jgi:hypothetical protein
VPWPIMAYMQLLTMARHPDPPVLASQVNCSAVLELLVWG